jgi:hypothetical protein
MYLSSLAAAPGWQRPALRWVRLRHARDATALSGVRGDGGLNKQECPASDFRPARHARALSGVRVDGGLNKQECPPFCFRVDGGLNKQECPPFCFKEMREKGAKWKEIGVELGLSDTEIPGYRANLREGAGAAKSADAGDGLGARGCGSVGVAAGNLSHGMGTDSTDGE